MYAEEGGNSIMKNERNPCTYNQQRVVCKGVYCALSERSEPFVKGITFRKDHNPSKKLRPFGKVTTL